MPISSTAHMVLAATVLDLAKSGSSFSADQFVSLAVGVVISFVVALLSIKFLINYIKKHTFTPFGVYRVIIALVFMATMFR